MPIYLHYVVLKHKGNFGLKLSNIAQASRIVDLDSRRRLTERRSSRSGHFIPGKKVPASAGICVEIRLSWKEINRMNIENILTGEFRTPSQVGLLLFWFRIHGRDVPQPFSPLQPSLASHPHRPVVFIPRLTFSTAGRRHSLNNQLVRPTMLYRYFLRASRRSFVRFVAGRRRKSRVKNSNLLMTSSECRWLLTKSHSDDVIFYILIHHGGVVSVLMVIISLRPAQGELGRSRSAHIWNLHCRTTPEYPGHAEPRNRLMM